MSQNQAKIQELFRDTLLSDEEVYWIGEPLHNYWHLKGRYIFFVLCLAIPSALFGIGIWGLIFDSSWNGLMTFIACDALILSFYMLVVIAYIIGKRSEQEFLQPIVVGNREKAFYWWKPSYYAITNLRVLIFEQGSIRDYWYHLLDAPILKKPKNRAASIALYSSSYVAKKKKTPVLDTLRGIPEAEADDVFALLKQARDEALDERARKHGE